MSDGTIEVREKLYEVAVQFTGVTEYGVSMEALLAEEVPPPPEGARFDVAFEGTMSGERLNGSLRGVDYLWMRADGRTELHIHASIATDDGARISFFADGLGLNDGSGELIQLRESVTLITNHPEYSWVNGLAIWAVGTVDPMKGEVRVTAYVV